MALLMTEGFDQYTTATDYAVRHTRGGSDTVATTGGIRGGPCLELANNGYLEMGFTGFDISTITMRMAFYFKIAGTTFGSGSDLWLQIRDTGSTWQEIRIHGDQGKIQVMRWGDNGSTVAESGPNMFKFNGWNHVAIEQRIHDSLGVSKVWIDQQLVINFSGDNYASNGRDCDAIRLYGINQTTRFDDVMIWTNEGTDFVTSLPIKNHYIETLKPNSDVVTDFTTNDSGGLHFNYVDENGIHDGDTTYIESSTITDVDRFGFENQFGTPDKTHAISVHSRCRNTDAGAPVVKNVIRHGTTTINGTGVALGTSYVHVADNYGQNPDTVADWGTSDVNTVEAGIRYDS